MDNSYFCNLNILQKEASTVIASMNERLTVDYLKIQSSMLFGTFKVQLSYDYFNFPTLSIIGENFFNVKLDCENYA